MGLKLILTHETRLREKYGADGWALLRRACDRLAEADLHRGLTTRLVRLDHAGDLLGTRGEPVPVAGDAAASKRAMDAVCSAWHPRYVVLLGGPDVVPHQILANPLAGREGDPDRAVPSDLPYACAGVAGDLTPCWREPDFLVGRLPDAPMTAPSPERFANPDLLLIQLEHVTRWQPRPAESYRFPFALGSRLWEQSTRATVRNVFGDEQGLAICPPTLSGMHGEGLRALSHYLNCHGASGDDRIYGGHPRGPLFLALDSSELKGRIVPGVVVTSEGCCGAELFDPATHEGRIPLPLAYLREGAHAYWGSTCVSYGHSDHVGPASRLCRLFHGSILDGLSTGQAARVARGTLARESGPTLDATTLKTLAQFLLLGDPSIRPVG